MMASPALLPGGRVVASGRRLASCCLRPPLLSPNPTTTPSMTTSTSLLTQQTRTIRHRALPTNNHDTFGVLVRLLTDVPRYGPKGTVLRVRGGTMRNHWFPKGMAEYVTPSMLRSLGLNPYGGGEGLKVERDVAFVPKSQQMRRADGAEEAGRGGAAAADLSNRERRARAELAKVVVEPQRARELVAALPDRLVFARRPIARPASVTDTEDSEGQTATAIYGSVSAQDIVERIRSLLDEADASHSSEDGGKHVVPLSADDVTIANLPDDADRIKHLGTFSVTISGEGWPEGVVKTVEVVAED